MGIAELLASKRDAILRIASRHGAYDVRVFGSVARGEARPDSDVDLLVPVASQHSPWFPVGLVMELEQLLGRRVDITTPRGLRDRVRERVLAEAVPL